MTTTVLNTKISEVKNKIQVVSDLVKKKDYTAKVSEIEEKYISTYDYNKFAKETLDARIKQKKLVSKADISLKFCYITLKMLTQTQNLQH